MKNLLQNNKILVYGSNFVRFNSDFHSCCCFWYWNLLIKFVQLLVFIKEMKENSESSKIPEIGSKSWINLVIMTQPIWDLWVREFNVWVINHTNETVKHAYTSQYWKKSPVQKKTFMWNCSIIILTGMLYFKQRLVTLLLFCNISGMLYFKLRLVTLLLFCKITKFLF